MLAEGKKLGEKSKWSVRVLRVTVGLDLHTVVRTVVGSTLSLGWACRRRSPPRLRYRNLRDGSWEKEKEESINFLLVLSNLFHGVRDTRALASPLTSGGHLTSIQHRRWKKSSDIRFPTVPTKFHIKTLGDKFRSQKYRGI